MCGGDGGGGGVCGGSGGGGGVCVVVVVVVVVVVCVCVCGDRGGVGRGFLGWAIVHRSCVCPRTICAYACLCACMRVRTPV